jgi:hypothetical protein
MTPTANPPGGGNGGGLREVPGSWENGTAVNESSKPAVAAVLSGFVFQIYFGSLRRLESASFRKCLVFDKVLVANRPLAKAWQEVRTPAETDFLDFFSFRAILSNCVEHTELAW